MHFRTFFSITSRRLPNPASVPVPVLVPVEPRFATTCHASASSKPFAETTDLKLTADLKNCLTAACQTGSLRGDRGPPRPIPPNYLLSSPRSVPVLVAEVREKISLHPRSAGA